MAKNTETKGQVEGIAPRNWVFSTLVAAVVIGLSVLLSATVNPMFGRSVHLDWMAVVAPASFIFLLLSVRRRWV